MYKANGLCIKQYIFSTINQGVEGEVMASILNWCMSCICMPKKCLFIHVILQIFLFYLKRIGKGMKSLVAQLVPLGVFNGDVQDSNPPNTIVTIAL